jgi:hypothetical protein
LSYQKKLNLRTQKIRVLIKRIAILGKIRREKQKKEKHQKANVILPFQPHPLLHVPASSPSQWTLLQVCEERRGEERAKSLEREELGKRREEKRRSSPFIHSSSTALIYLCNT